MPLYDSIRGFVGRSRVGYEYLDTQPGMGKQHRSYFAHRSPDRDEKSNKTRRLYKGPSEARALYYAEQRVGILAIVRSIIGLQRPSAGDRAHTFRERDRDPSISFM